MKFTRVLLACFLVCGLSACDKVESALNPQTSANPKTLSGVYVSNSSKLGDALKRMGINEDATETMDFRRDGTVIRTFLKKDSRGTYSMDGNNVVIVWPPIKTGDVESPEQTVIYTVEGDDLLDPNGRRCVRQK